MGERESLLEARPIAALYVTKGGCYFGLNGVDPWDKERDARLYDGPYPVVAHPPCARWSNLAHIHKHRWPIGADGGCFYAALDAVKTYGGVLEHPAGTLAWDAFGLPKPQSTGGWTYSFLDEGASCCVDQGRYGHRARKRTWLYAVGVDLPQLDWRPAHGYPVENMSTRGGEASRTPTTFRDVLIAMARSAYVTKSVAA